MMKRRRLAPVILLLSLIFNAGVVIHFGIRTVSLAGWFLPSLGPAVIQDSYLGRAPALETLFGAIGDVPGGYPMYTGNPLQMDDLDRVGSWMGTPLRPLPPQSQIDIPTMLLALCMLAIPVLTIIFLGRRSYGYSTAC